MTPLDSLADLSRKDLLGLMWQMIGRIGACDNVDCFAVSDKHVATAVAALNESLTDYPDVDPAPVRQAVEYIHDILNNLDEIRMFYAYGYDAVMGSEQNRSFSDFVDLTYDIGCKRDDVDDPSQFPLFRRALDVWELLYRTEALAVFGGCVVLLVIAIDCDGIGADYETAIEASGALYHTFEEPEGPDHGDYESYVEMCDDIFLAVEAMHPFLDALSTSSTAKDRYPRRWNWESLIETVACVARIENEAPLRYAVDYVGQVTPGCPDDDPPLAALAESYLTSGLHTTMLDAVEEATEQLALMNDLTDMNRAGSTS